MVRDEAASSRLRPVYFFQFPNLSYLKIKWGGAGRHGAVRVGMGWKIPKPVPFTFDFLLIFYICFFIILKLIYFIKNKNLMNFYKLFIKKHFNYYYYLY